MESRREPESGHDCAKRGIASGRSPSGASKEAKEAKHGMNQPRRKEDASKGDQEPPESGTKSKGRVVPERRAAEWGLRLRAKRPSKKRKSIFVVHPKILSPRPHKHLMWLPCFPKKGKAIAGNRLTPLV